MDQPRFVAGAHPAKGFNRSPSYHPIREGDDGTKRVGGLRSDPIIGLSLALLNHPLYCGWF